MTNMRPKTYFLRPDVAIPLGFALVRELWNQKVGRGARAGWGARGCGHPPGGALVHEPWQQRQQTARCARAPAAACRLRAATVGRAAPGRQRLPRMVGRHSSWTDRCLPAPLRLQVMGRPSAYVMPPEASK